MKTKVTKDELFLMQLRKATARGLKAIRAAQKWEARARAAESSLRIEQGLAENRAQALLTQAAEVQGNAGPRGREATDEVEALFREVALGPDYIEFLTLPGYSVLE